MVGRGARLSPGKKNCHVVDFVDLFNDSSQLANIPSLLGLDPDSVLNSTNITNHDELKDFQKPTPDEDSNLDSLYFDPESEFGFRVISRRIKDPYSIFRLSKADLETLKRGFTKDPSFDYIHNIQTRAEALTCGDPSLLKMSKLSWVAVTENLYMISSKLINVFIQRVITESSNNNDDSVLQKDSQTSTAANQKVEYICFYRHRLSTKPKGKKSSGQAVQRQFLTKATPIPIAADTLSIAIKAVETFLKDKIPKYELFLLTRKNPWRLQKPTPKQIKYLTRLGIPTPVIKRHLSPINLLSGDFGTEFPLALEKANTLDTQKISPNVRDALAVSEKLLEKEKHEKELKKTLKFYQSVGVLGKKSTLVDALNLINGDSFGYLNGLCLTKGSVANLIIRLSYGSGADSKKNNKPSKKNVKEKSPLL
ncbi:hypothetical protein BB560_000159 [Smittium megazygosporum]|uniref:Uncharacterized protein n=1 Tax=Smittium megazygosporum TaxID=133381 RepID=A0A2T9ZL60_9FUNG|nr:hypothetical protein BB560_000159 [Smittium megazygosporum]